MSNDRRYIRAYRNEFADPDSGAPFIISMADGTVYASRDLTAFQLKQLRREIDDALLDGNVEVAPGDINGDPQEEIIF